MTGSDFKEEMTGSDFMEEARQNNDFSSRYRTAHLHFQLQNCSANIRSQQGQR